MGYENKSKEDLIQELEEMKRRLDLRNIIAVDPFGLELFGVGTGQVTSPAQTFLVASDIMGREVETAAENDFLTSAAASLSHKNISSLIVVNNNKETIGILTEKDITHKIATSDDVDLKTIRVKDAMSSPVVSVSPATSLFDIRRLLFEKNFRRVPVVEKGQPVGIITQSDISLALTGNGLWKDIHQIMSKDLVTISTDKDVYDAVNLMSKHNISCLIVKDGDHVKGILTERDIVNKVMAHGQDPKKVTVEKIMGSPVITALPNLSLFSAISLMRSKKIRRLVVMEGSRLLGLVTQSDVFREVKRTSELYDQSIYERLNHSPYNIFITDAMEKILFVNDSFAKLFQIPNQGAVYGQVGLPPNLWAQPEEREKFFGELKEKQFVAKKDVMLITPQGNTIYTDIVCHLILNFRSEAKGHIGIILDVTARREAEENLKRLNQELEARVNDRTRELEAKLSDLETFTKISVRREIKLKELEKENQLLKKHITTFKGFRTRVSEV